MNGWGPADAVGFIRLSCLPELQRALDAKYTVQQWSELSTEAALEAIKQIVVLPTNQAAEKEQFYNLKQGPYESISAYFTRATTVAANCDFKCPECAVGLGDYLLLSKTAVGLSDSALKKEVFRSFHTFDSHAELRGFCIAYETAMRSSASEHHGRDNLAAIAGVEQGASAAGDDDIIAATSRQQRRHPRVERHQPHAVGAKQNTSSCDYCNWNHAAGRANCPARRVVCHHCGKTGHFEAVCRNKKVSEANPAASAVIIAAASGLPQPTVKVNIHAGTCGATETITVVDTGAMVCVAGPKLMLALGLSKNKLTKCG